MERTFSANWKSISSLEFEEQVPCTDVIQFKFEDDAPNWVFDFVFWDERTIIEINGGTYRGKNGGHSSGPGIKKGYFKSICTQVMDWNFYELDNSMVNDIPLLEFIQDTMLGKCVWPHPKALISFGNNKRDVNRAVAAEKTLANWVQKNSRPNPGDFCFLSTTMMKVLMPYKKGRSKLSRGHVRNALDALGFRKGKKSIGGKPKVAYYHTKYSAALYDDKL